MFVILFLPSISVVMSVQSPVTTKLRSEGFIFHNVWGISISSFSWHPGDDIDDTSEHQFILFNYYSNTFTDDSTVSSIELIKLLLILIIK